MCLWHQALWFMLMKVVLLYMRQEIEGIVQKDRGATQVKIGKCHWSHNGLQTIESWPI